MRKSKEQGFTLIELIIVVAIIGILAAAVVVKYRDMMEKSREGATKGNIGSILSSISVYNANNFGNWPDDISIPEYTEYLSPLPAVKVTHPNGGTSLSGKSNEVEIVSDTVDNGNGKSHGKALGKFKFKDDTDGWRYEPESGGIRVNNGQTDSKGIFYTYYGYE